MGLYKQRLYRSYPPVECAGVRLKPYTIAAAGREDFNIQAALDYAAVALAASPVAWMRHRGLGYLMHHRGEDGNWFLLRVWLEGDIQAGLLSADHGRGFEPVTMPACECVWEGLVTCHEREAWIRHMMSETENPDGYLADRLEDGFH
ncbi:hypothetical protein [Roseibium sp.]|uniref:hypothetical protein n=1 Tax=Roseibium sp. TaxID=1936156 RepID=UPI003D1218B1